MVTPDDPAQVKAEAERNLLNHCECGIHCERGKHTLIWFRHSDNQPLLLSDKVKRGVRSQRNVSVIHELAQSESVKSFAV